MLMKTNFLYQLLQRFQNTRIFDGLNGTDSNNFHYRNTSNNRNFKPNQRKGRSVGKHRRMKLNSR